MAYVRQSGLGTRLPPTDFDPAQGANAAKKSEI